MAERLAEVRRAGALPFLRPDGKTQVTLGYDGAVPKTVESVVLSTQHHPDISQDDLRAAVRAEVIDPVLAATGLDLPDVKYYINPAGPFVDGRAQGRRGSHRPQDHHRHLRRRVPPRRRRVQRQGPVEGRPLRRVRDALGRQERRRRRPRRPARGAGRVRDRQGQAGRPLRRDVRHRARAGRRHHARDPRACSTCARRRSSTSSICCARSTRRPPPTATSAASCPTSRGSAPTASTTCARPPVCEPCPRGCAGARVTSRRVARVLIDSPLPQLDRLFDYAIPRHLDGRRAAGRARARAAAQRRPRRRRASSSSVGEPDASDRPLSELDAVVSPVPVLTPGALRARPPRRRPRRRVGERHPPPRHPEADGACREGVARRARPLERPWSSDVARRGRTGVLGEFPGLADAIDDRGERLAVDAPPRPARRRRRRRGRRVGGAARRGRGAHARRGRQRDPRRSRSPRPSAARSGAGRPRARRRRACGTMPGRARRRATRRSCARLAALRAS